MPVKYLNNYTRKFDTKQCVLLYSTWNSDNIELLFDDKTPKSVLEKVANDLSYEGHWKECYVYKQTMYFSKPDTYGLYYNFESEFIPMLTEIFSEYNYELIIK